MSPVWIAFTIGMFLGAVVGMMALALCVAAKRGDEHLESFRSVDKSVRVREIERPDQQVGLSTE